MVWACTGLFLVQLAAVQTARNDSWHTLNHRPGYCALYGVCGHRNDSGHSGLDCPLNQPGKPLSGPVSQKLQETCPQLASEFGPDGNYCCTEEQLDTLTHQIAQASTLLVGCPACDHNFKHFFCTLTCHPDQATFVNVTAVQQTADTNITAVAEASYYISDAFGKTFYQSCKDVVYGLLNIKAMQLVGGGAQNFQQWFDFLGLIKDKQPTGIGAPYQMDFPGEQALPAGMTAMKEGIPTCWDPAFKCSCGDCPDAPQCVPPPPPAAPVPYGCTALGLGPNSLSCLDLSLLILYLLFLAALLYLFFAKGIFNSSFATRWGSLKAALLSRGDPHEGNGGADMRPLLDDGADGTSGESPRALDTDIAGSAKGHHSPFERRLQPAFYRLGVYCGAHPYRVLLVCSLAIGVCCLGMLRFRVQTDPQHLWVGATSLAAKEKAQYEASFGGFYRVEQLIISSTPETPSYHKTASGVAPIVSKANIQWLFKVQAIVDSLSAAYTDPTTGQEKSATLADICFKPLGADCAVESVLQYWQMNPQIYNLGRLSPEFCFGHWSTQCRSAFEAPIDPNTVLGGFPTNASSRTKAWQCLRGWVGLWQLRAPPSHWLLPVKLWLSAWAASPACLLCETSPFVLLWQSCWIMPCR